MISHFFKMLVCGKKITAYLIAFLSKLIYKHYNLYLWDIDFLTRRKNNEVFYHFHFREIFIFNFRATILYQCFHRFIFTQKKT